MAVGCIGGVRHPSHFHTQLGEVPAKEDLALGLTPDPTDVLASFLEIGHLSLRRCA